MNELRWNILDGWEELSVEKCPHKHVRSEHHGILWGEKVTLIHSRCLYGGEGQMYISTVDAARVLGLGATQTKRLDSPLTHQGRPYVAINRLPKPLLPQ